MRSDMWKVIVERPRLGRGYADALGRRARKILPRDHEGDGLDVIEPLRPRRSKSLNENLAPLRRFLEKQVGRPWDKVYSEMRREISFDNVVQKHVLQHLDDFLARDVQIVDGVVYRKDGWPVTRSRRNLGLYVDPRTGIIRALRRDKKKRSERRDDFAPLHAGACLYRIDGAWFEVTLAEIPSWLDNAQRVVDVITKSAPYRTYFFNSTTWHRYGAPNVYAVAKRQLSKREVRAHRAAGRIRS